MKKEQETALKILAAKGTDSDIEDFCRENNIQANEAFRKIQEWSAPTCCMGCKHIEMFDNLYPCNICTRQSMRWITMDKNCCSYAEQLFYIFDISREHISIHNL